MLTVTRGKGRWWLGVLALLCLTPVLSTAQRADKNKGCTARDYYKCQQVPEGGSGMVYLLGTGIACLGALLVRSRVVKAHS